MDLILDALDGAKEDVRPFYIEKDGKFHLDPVKYATALVEKETGGLKAKVDELLGEKKTVAEKAKAAQDAADKAAAEAAAKSGDVDALRKSFETLQAKNAEQSAAEKAELSMALERATVKATATALAADLAVQGSAGVLERLIAPRLKMELKDGQASVVVTDATGKPSALSLDDYKAELSSDPALAPLLSGSKASGGGAASANGGAGNAKTVTRSQWDQMDHPARAAHSKSGGKVVDA